MSSTRDGTIYIGSAGRQQVFRVRPGMDTAEVFIAPGAGGLTGVVGVFADDASKSVWVCSNVRAGSPAANAVPRPRNALMAFDLKTGAPKGRYEFPEGGTCNDAAAGPDGSIYATDTSGMQVLRLPRGGKVTELKLDQPVQRPDGMRVSGKNSMISSDARGKLMKLTTSGRADRRCRRRSRSGWWASS